MDKAEASQESNFKDMTIQFPNESENQLAELLSMGFEESLCREALRYTNDQQKLIELIFQFQEDRKRASYPQKTEFESISQQEESISDTVSMIDSYKMVFLVRTDLYMDIGQIATQVGHAVIGAYKNITQSIKIEWREDLFLWEGSGAAKIVLAVSSNQELTELYTKARDSGLNTYLVVDTLIEPGSYTACAIGPSKSTIIDKVTGHLKLL